MEKRNFETQQRGWLFESCPPKDSVEPSRGRMARATEYVMDDYFYEFEKPEEKKMKRSIISMIGILTFCGIGLTASLAMADDDDRRANATVSFGEWKADFSPPLDRLLADPTGGAGNNHELIPQIATIKAGGAVNFIISGGHVVAVYDDGTQPGDINLAKMGIPFTQVEEAYDHGLRTYEIVIRDRPYFSWNVRG